MINTETVFIPMIEPRIERPRLIDRRRLIIGPRLDHDAGTDGANGEYKACKGGGVKFVHKASPKMSCVRQRIELARDVSQGAYRRVRQKGYQRRQTAHSAPPHQVRKTH